MVKTVFRKIFEKISNVTSKLQSWWISSNLLLVSKQPSNYGKWWTLVNNMNPWSTLAVDRRKFTKFHFEKQTTNVPAVALKQYFIAQRKHGSAWINRVSRFFWCHAPRSFGVGLRRNLSRLDPGLLPHPLEPGSANFKQYPFISAKLRTAHVFNNKTKHCHNNFDNKFGDKTAIAMI